MLTDYVNMEQMKNANTAQLLVTPFTGMIFGQIFLCMVKIPLVMPISYPCFDFLLCCCQCTGVGGGDKTPLAMLLD